MTKWSKAKAAKQHITMSKIGKQQEKARLVVSLETSSETLLEKRETERRNTGGSSEAECGREELICKRREKIVGGIG